MSERTANWVSGAAAPAKLRALGRTSMRYAVSIFGPLSVSAAHFVASLIFLRGFAPADFGLFSFLLVVVPFLGISSTGSLLNAPLGNLMVQNASFDAPEYSTLLKAALVVTVLVGVLTFGLLLISHAPLEMAALAAPYGSFMALRWFGRGYAFAEDRKIGAAISDVVYSFLLIAGLFALLFMHRLSVTAGAGVMLGASVLGVAALGMPYLKRQFWHLGCGSLFAYKPIWIDMTRWALFGVVLSEMTNNAHVYLVTFVSGPGAFAVLAVGALVMRPVSLVLSALPDFERPRMARALAANDMRHALQCVNEFRTAGGAIWAATLVLAAILLTWFPHLILKHGYNESQVLIVIAIWAVIMAARVVRTPESILLQSAGAFKPLASASLKSSIVSLVATLVLLLTFGPLPALGGILLGELVMTFETVRLFRGWRAGRG